MAWMTIDFDEQNGPHLAAVLQREFDSLFTNAGSPTGAAMFCSSNAFEFVFFFSPKAVDIAGGYLQIFKSAKPTGQPSKESVALLVGHADAWDMLAS